MGKKRKNRWWDKKCEERKKKEKRIKKMEKEGREG